MNDKVKAGIERIHLDEATYHDQVVDATAINFFYGRNGSGKSTLTRAIKRGSKVELIPQTDGSFKEGYLASDNPLDYANGGNPLGYTTLIYDTDFVKRNFVDNPTMPGVFTITEQKANIRKTIEKKEDEKKDIEKNVKVENGKGNVVIQQKKKYEDDFKKKIYSDYVSPTKNRYPLCDTKMKTADSAIKETQAMSRDLRDPHPYTDEEIKTFYDTAFSEQKDRYEPLFEPKKPYKYKEYESSDLWETSIESHSQTELAVFYQQLGNIRWVKEGHDNYAHATGGYCPYCHQELKPDFEEEFAKCFDQTYKTLTQKLNEVSEAYKSAIQSIFQPMANNLTSKFPNVKTSQLREKLEVLKAAVLENTTEIDKKLKDPSIKIQLKPIDSEIEEVVKVIQSLNEAIKKNNDIVEGGDKKKKECASMVRQQLACTIRAALVEHDKKLAQYDADAKVFYDKAIEIGKEAIKLQEEIDELRKDTADVEAVAGKINDYLAQSGFTGFKLVPANDAGDYRVAREGHEGEEVHDLSEGERNFLGFLYFYFTVDGSLSLENASRPKIVVIDDPVSSMDSSALFLVSSMVRKLLQACHHYNEPSEKADEPMNIAQIFVLTHNVFFHKNITLAQDTDDRYKRVVFNLIHKDGNNNSTVIPCIRERKAAAGTFKENYNPVQNSYTTLWIEYLEVTSEESVLNVIRRILEYYFIQLCGNNGMDLRKAIFETDEGKKKFIHINPSTGKPDNRNFDAADTMLQYLNEAPSVTDDGLNYVKGGCADPNVYRKVFRKIFECMGQISHYDMMIRAARKSVTEDIYKRSTWVDDEEDEAAIATTESSATPAEPTADEAASESTVPITPVTLEADPISDPEELPFN